MDFFSQLLLSSSSILIQFSESKQFPWKQSQQFPGSLGMDTENHWAPRCDLAFEQVFRMNVLFIMEKQRMASHPH